MIGNTVVTKIFFFMMTSFLMMSSCISEKNLIRSAASYIIERTPGTIQTPTSDDGVVKIDTVIIIYIQSKRSDLIWDSAVVNWQAYKLTAQILNTNAYEAGTNALTGQKEIVTVASGNVLYQIQFQNIRTQNQVNILSETVLHFRNKNKSFTMIMNKPVFLLPQTSL